MSHFLKTKGYNYHSFDAQYRYGLVGISDYSPSTNWGKILDICGDHPWVLDNWTTEDSQGTFLHGRHPDATIYLLYDSHKGILDRYRVPITGPDAYYGMYQKMYRQRNFEDYVQEVRCFLSRGGSYRETEWEEFHQFMEVNGHQDKSRTFDEETWRWL